LGSLQNIHGEISYTLRKLYSTGSVEFIPATGNLDVNSFTNASTKYTISLNLLDLTVGTHIITSRPIIPNILYTINITLDGKNKSYRDISFTGLGGVMTARNNPPLSLGGFWNSIQTRKLPDTFHMGEYGDMPGTQMEFQFSTYLPYLNNSGGSGPTLHINNFYEDVNMDNWVFSVNGGSWQSVAETNGHIVEESVVSGLVAGGKWRFAWRDVGSGTPFSKGDKVIMKYKKPDINDPENSLSTINADGLIQYALTQQTLPLIVQ